MPVLLPAQMRVDHVDANDGCFMTESFELGPFAVCAQLTQSLRAGGTFGLNMQNPFVTVTGGIGRRAWLAGSTWNGHG